MKSKILRTSAFIAGVLGLGSFWYVKAHPLIFNESFFEHAHCILIADGILEEYAQAHGGKFPDDTNGYGDALLLVVAADPGAARFLTGPCFDEKPFLQALKNGGHLSESQCGRVYVQGLTVSNNPAIVILFDKIPTPGGDHCHMFQRFKTPLAREAMTVGNGLDYVPESDWPLFAKKQVELLVQAGMTREHAESLYSEGR